VTASLNVQRAAREIDAYFDSLEYDGMPLEMYRQLETQRDAAHQNLLNRAISDGHVKVGQA
jgi:hypothetical protein